MRLINACSPDWYQPLCDSDTPRGASLKRVRRAVDRTVNYLDKCLELQANHPVSCLSYLSITYVRVVKVMMVPCKNQSINQKLFRVA